MLDFCNNLLSLLLYKYRIRMESSEQTPEDYIEIANKIRSGEYFRDARAMVDIDIHEPMAERYWYLFITFMSLMITAVAIVACLGFFPLKTRVPFIFGTNNIVDDYPRIRSLLTYIGEDSNFALRRHLIQHYVKLREEYDASFFDTNHSAVVTLTDKAVLQEYEDFISPLNPDAPVTLYQRNIKRKVNIISIINIENNIKKQSDTKEYNMRVVYDAVLKKGEQENQQGRYQVDIAFKYKDIKLEKTTGKIEPYGFIVTSYQIEKL